MNQDSRTIKTAPKKGVLNRSDIRRAVKSVCVKRKQAEEFKTRNK